MWLVLADHERGWYFHLTYGSFRLWMGLVLSICAWMAQIAFRARSIVFISLLF